MVRFCWDNTRIYPGEKHDSILTAPAAEGGRAAGECGVAAAYHHTEVWCCLNNDGYFR